MCFAFDNNAVSSAKELYSWIEETNTIPLGLEYIAHKITKIQVKTGLTPRQADRVYWMFWDLRRRRSGSEVAARPIRFVNFLFQKTIKVHRPRDLGRGRRATLFLGMQWRELRWIDKADSRVLALDDALLLTKESSALSSRDTEFRQLTCSDNRTIEADRS